MATFHGRYGTHGRVLSVDLTDGSHEELALDEDVYRQFLGGYGLGAYLMWKHFPAGADAESPEACFAIVSGLLTGVKTPFSGRIQIVGKSPLTGTWADSNSGGSVAIQLRRAGYDALIVKGRATEPSVLVVQDGEVRVEPAGELWGTEIPEAFDTLRTRYGKKSEVGVSAIGPAGEKRSKIASVMNDRYHAFGRQGFGAIYGSKNLKAIVVGGTGSVPVADEPTFRALCEGVNKQYKRDTGLFMRIAVWFLKPKKWLGFFYRAARKLGMKLETPQAAFRQLWADYGTTSAVALSVENGDAPIKNWKGVGPTDFPLASKSLKVDGGEVRKIIEKKLSCGDCPAPCKGIVGVKKRGLTDVRRPDYETLVGFGANLLNDDLELVAACHDACNRYGMDAVSSSATLAWVAEAMDEGALTADDLDGIDMRWGNGEAALALTEKIGKGEGCGEWLRHGSASAAKHVGKGSEAYVIAVRGQEPAYHDPRFSSLMGLTFVSDPTPGRHTAGGASWQECFGAGFPIPGAVADGETKVSWNGDAGKGVAQAHFSNAHQVMNGLGLCLFTNLTGGLPWLDLTNALTGWDLTPEELLACGERIQHLRHSFNVREGLTPKDFVAPPRMFGAGDGKLSSGPLKDVVVPIAALRRDYHAAMKWNDDSGRLSRVRAEQLGIDGLLEGYLEA
ncbi:MAG: aldehyde ferredoxin oxidoreductase family protein [Deltaproteobacteria bacterium]